MAAVEYYLKNDKEGQRLLAELEEEQESSQGQDRGHSFGGLFLEGLSLNEDDTVRYSLMVEERNLPLVQRFGGVYVYVAYQMNVLMLFEIFLPSSNL